MKLILALLALILTTAALYGCGGASGLTAEQGASGTVPNLPPVPAGQPGVGMPQLTGETFDLDSIDKGTSATYQIYFRDTVNESSGPRWSSTNLSGKKAWTLTNSYFSAPKAWQLGGNYWNIENDDLYSNTFNVNSGDDGLAVTYYARWNVMPGDNAVVNFWDGMAWNQVAMYLGANPSYPGWDKFYYKLPKNITPSAQSCYLDFHFDSNNDNLTSFGFAIDSVAVYQTQVSAPTALTASDGGTAGQVDLSWSYTPQGNLIPDRYNIYRAPDNGGVPGTYGYLNFANYPATTYSDMTGNGDTYWYIVTAAKDGWPSSDNSNEDSGYGDGTWTIVNITNDAEGDGSNSSLAVINGNPAVTWRRATSGGGVAYSRSSTLDGASAADWSAPVFVDTGDMGLRGQSLTQVSGRPAVSYYDIDFGNVQYARAADADGTDWSGAGSAKFTVDDGGASDVGRESTLRVTSDGFPCMAYTDSSSNDIKFAISTDADGATQANWSSYALYDGTTVQHPWMEIVNGNPAIAFSEPTGTGQVSYWRASDASPAQTDWNAVNFAAVVTGTFASYPAMFVCNGNPGVAYLDGNSDVWFARCSSSDGDGNASWVAGTLVNVDSNANNFDFCRGNYLLGKPRIVYYDVVNEDVFMATGTTANGDSFWNIQNVDGLGGPRRGEPGYPILVDGKMAFTYRNLDNDDLMYAIYQ